MTEQPAADALAEIRRKMAAAATDQPAPEQLAEWSAADKEMARRINKIRPGVPTHHAFATLDTLRTIQRLDAPAVPAGQASATDQTAPELTVEEARDLADDLGLQLYRAQDALAFVEECCVIADREQRPVTTAMVREWLKGARCGRQLLADATDRAALQYAFRVTEIRDNTVRRVHGYYASLQGAFAYCETEERKQPLVDTVRFELFAAPGGERWLIHTFYGPDDPWPEVSDLVITRVTVIPDATPADEAMPALPAGGAQQPQEPRP